MTTQNTLDAQPATPDRLSLVPSGNDWHFTCTVDFGGGSYFTQERHQSHNSRSFHEFHGHARTYDLAENADGSLFDAWMTGPEVAPLLARIHAGYESVWDGSNHVARFDADAAEAKDALDDLFHDCAYPTLDAGGLYDACDWLCEVRHDIIRDHGITAETDDARLGEIAAVLETEAAGEYVKLDGTENYLRGLRDNLAAQEEE